LQRLRGGATKVIITSRSEEEWLGTEQRRKVELGGLDGEDRWAYADAILGDLGITIDRGDKDLVELMKLLDGHPLAMRVVLPRMEKQRAGELCVALRSNLAALGEGGDEAQKKIYATLKLVEDVLPEDLKPLLVLLGLHERFVDGDYLETMAKQVDEAWTRQQIDRFLGALSNAGLLRDRGQAIHEMHPVLTGFLRATAGQEASEGNRDRWSRSFVDFMGDYIDMLAPLKRHEQRDSFHVHSANFYHALNEAKRLSMDLHQGALTQGLATNAHNTRNFSEAQALFERLAEVCREVDAPEKEGAAYHQLGNIAQDQRDFAAAADWYHKSLEFKEKQGNEHGAAITYHQLGVIAQKQHDFVAAKNWYHKALAINKEQGDDYNTAITYHQLGRIAEDHHDFSAAEDWYRKALAIKEKQGNEHGAASTYHQLGVISQKQHDFAAAKDWYHKALAISEKQGNEHDAACTYHQLGIIAQKQRHLTAAEALYHRSLAINEKQGDERGAAITYAQLSVLAALQGHVDESGRWLIKAICAFKSCNDPESAQQTTSHFLAFHNAASLHERAKLEGLWKTASLGDLPVYSEPNF
jgi:tetratricopeptide (TPR) repeat protein